MHGAMPMPPLEPGHRGRSPSLFLRLGPALYAALEAESASRGVRPQVYIRELLLRSLRRSGAYPAQGSAKAR